MLLSLSYPGMYKAGLRIRIRFRKWCWIPNRFSDLDPVRTSRFKIHLKLNFSFLEQSDNTVLKYQLYWLLYGRKRWKVNSIRLSLGGIKIFFFRGLDQDSAFSERSDPDIFFSWRSDPHPVSSCRSKLIRNLGGKKGLQKRN